MPKDFRLEITPPNQMRREDKACSDEWTREFLISAPVGHLATLWDDQPFITPTSFWYDPEQHEIYFHSNITGRMRANAEHQPRICFEASRMGALLPSNVALEFSVQYESVVVFGQIRMLEGEAEKRRALYGLLAKYFPDSHPGEQYRPITDQELTRTCVYAIAIESWSGKRSWPTQAKQSPDWPPL